MKHILSLILIGFSTTLMGQHEELAQKCSAFVADHDSLYEKKYLNISNPPIGDIDDTDYEFAERFMLESRDRVKSNIDNNIYAKYYVNVYGYADEYDRDWALKHWFSNFIEGESIRPGRDKRSYDYAHPTIIIINNKDVAILHYECQLYDRDSFQNWREKMLSYFGDVNSIVIEVQCDGPLKWTKNPPDPRDRRWR
ncbi:MAG: hypothetical protein EP346_11190 [Bacteroidetes bacterium]|nr:MAG: hypothetical protein EP346_11190 [Bacteroidota bacterium]